MKSIAYFALALVAVTAFVIFVMRPSVERVTIENLEHQRNSLQATCDSLEDRCFELELQVPFSRLLAGMMANTLLDVLEKGYVQEIVALRDSLREFRPPDPLDGILVCYIYAGDEWHQVQGDPFIRDTVVVQDTVCVPDTLILWMNVLIPAPTTECDTWYRWPHVKLQWKSSDWWKGPWR